MPEERRTLLENYALATGRYEKFVPPTKLSRIAFHSWARDLTQEKADKWHKRDGRIGRRLGRWYDRQVFKHEKQVEDLDKDLRTNWLK